MKSSASLVGCVNPGVAVVKYPYESTSLAKLLQLVAATLKGRLALSIALLVHGQPGYFKICSQKVSGLQQATPELVAKRISMFCSDVIN